MIIMIILIILIMMMLISVAFLTLLERKILAKIQLRKGPNKIFLKGFMQPISDAIKLLFKEFYFMDLEHMLFILSPMLMFLLSMMLWIFYPWSFNLFNMSNSLIMLMLMLSLNVYPIIMIGWNTNSNYSMLGSYRSIAQMISFEIMMFLLVFMLMLMIESYSMFMFYYYQYKIKFMILLYPLYLMFLLSLLVELNRTPFDLIEGESELVSGFNIEYSSSFFTLIFLSEYSNMLFMSMILSMLFYGLKYWKIGFILIYLFHLFMFILIRGVLPRIRYDELMYMCWTILLMMSLIYLFYIYIIKEIIHNI